MSSFLCSAVPFSSLDLCSRQEKGPTMKDPRVLSPLLLRLLLLHSLRFIDRERRNGKSIFIVLRISSRIYNLIMIRYLLLSLRLSLFAFFRRKRNSTSPHFQSRMEFNNVLLPFFQAWFHFVCCWFAFFDSPRGENCGKQIRSVVSIFCGDDICNRIAILEDILAWERRLFMSTSAFGS